MRTLLPTLLCLLVCTPGYATTGDSQLRTFANCAGRLTAQLEHAWLMHDDSAETIEDQRAQVVELLSAIMPQEAGRDVLNWRIDARAAQRALLQRATFTQDPSEAEWAGNLAQQYVADCTGFLLS